MPSPIAAPTPLPAWAVLGAAVNDRAAIALARTKPLPICLTWLIAGIENRF